MSDTPARYDEEGPESTAPNLKPWWNRIKKARKLREEWEQDFDVKRCEDFYLGKQWKSKGPRVFNHFLATVKITQTNLLFENPKALVRPKPGREQTSARKASMAEEVLSSIMSQDDNFADASQLALLQAFFRVGVLKAIYDPKLEENPNAQRTVFEKDGDGNPRIDPNTGEEMPMVDPATGQPIIEPDFVVSDDTYRWEWVDAKNMLFPDSGPYMRKWPWIAEEVTVSLGEAKDDERFPEELRVQFKSNVKENRSGSSKSRTPSSDSDDDESSQLFQYVEVYDHLKKRWLCLADGQDFDEPLIDNSLPEGVEDNPYAILPGWTPILGPDPSPWPVPHVYSWLDVQEEYNIRREQATQGAKRSARKIIYDDSTFDDAEEALKMLQSSRDMEGVKVRDTTKPPVFIQEPAINPDIWNDTSALLNDYRVISGQTGAKLSGSSDSNTATEANFVERASNLRDAELQKAVYKWLRTALRKMLQLVRATLTNNMYVKLRGMSKEELTQMLMTVYGIPPEAVMMFPAFAQQLVQTFGNEKMEIVDRETLTFEADIDIQPGSTRPRSLAQEKAQFLEFMQIFAQFPQLAMSRALLDELARKYEFLNPAMVEELQMLAQTLMQVNANQAGRNQGGGGSSKENTEGQGNNESSQLQAQAARGIGG